MKEVRRIGVLKAVGLMHAHWVLTYIGPITKCFCKRLPIVNNVKTRLRLWVDW